MNIFRYTLYLPLFLSIASVTSTEEISPCANFSFIYNYPVATFCKDGLASGLSVVMDGYYAFSRPELMTCSCIMQTNQTDKLTFNPITNFDNAVLLNGSCGSRINIGNGSVEIACYVYGNMDVIAHQNVPIHLEKEKSEADTRYCILIQKENKSISTSISISCEAGIVSGSSTVSTSTHNKTTTYKSEATASGSLSFSSLQTTTGSIPQIDENKSIKKDDNTTLYVAVGVGCAVAVILGSVITWCMYTRNRTKRKEQQPNQPYNPAIYENDEDVLKDNVLYVSAESAETQNRLSRHLVADDNYSSVDLNGLEVSQQYNRNGNRISATSINVLKQKESDFVRGSESSTRSLTEHVLAPGDTGCEYAVVSKERCKTVAERRQHDSNSKLSIDNIDTV